MIRSFWADIPKVLVYPLDFSVLAVFGGWIRVAWAHLMFTARVATFKRLKSDVSLVTTVNPLTNAVAAMMASGVLVLNCCLSRMACSAIAPLRSNTVA